MAVKIETILTDDLGNRIVVSKEYSGEQSLLNTSLEATEQLIWNAKRDIGVLAEQELLKLNQRESNEKKKKVRLPSEWQK
jgi:hypothetical protein